MLKNDSKIIKIIYDYLKCRICQLCLASPKEYIVSKITN